MSKKEVPTDTELFQEVLLELAPTREEVTGLCSLLTRALYQHPLYQQDFLPVYRDMAHAIGRCLEDGFEHYSGVLSYPIAHPEFSPRGAYNGEELWARNTEYGRRRYAALAFLQERADQFTCKDQFAEYHKKD